MSVNINNNKAVDEAFLRLFGYPWRSNSHKNDTVNDEYDAATKKEKILASELLQIFGSKRIVTQILKLPSTRRPEKIEKDPAMLLTTKLAVASQNKRQSNAVQDLIPERKEYKKARLEPQEYQNVELPEDVIASIKESTAIPSTNAYASPVSSESKDKQPSNIITIPAVSHASTSNLDSVLKQISGTTKRNTVEKTSDDWEIFKGSDKQLQDELEQQAQSKNAYLVKQDFLNRVDQRRFELEKEERDQERARNAVVAPSTKM